MNERIKELAVQATSRFQELDPELEKNVEYAN